jgi:hypothetical protein
MQDTMVSSSGHLNAEHYTVVYICTVYSTHKHAAAQDTTVQYTIGHISMQQLKTLGCSMDEYT